MARVVAAVLVAFCLVLMAASTTGVDAVSVLESSTTSVLDRFSRHRLLARTQRQMRLRAETASDKPNEAKKDKPKPSSDPVYLLMTDPKLAGEFKVTSVKDKPPQFDLVANGEFAKSLAAAVKKPEFAALSSLSCQIIKEWKPKREQNTGWAATLKTQTGTFKLSAYAEENGDTLAMTVTSDDTAKIVLSFRDDDKTIEISDIASAATSNSNSNSEQKQNSNGGGGSGGGFLGMMSPWLEAVYAEAVQTHKFKQVELDDVASIPQSRMRLSTLSLWKYGVTLYLDKLGIVRKSWHNSESDWKMSAIVNTHRTHLEKAGDTTLKTIAGATGEKLTAETTAYIAAVRDAFPNKKDTMTIRDLLLSSALVESEVIKAGKAQSSATASSSSNNNINKKDAIDTAEKYQKHFNAFYDQVLVKWPIKGAEKEVYEAVEWAGKDDMSNSRLLKMSLTQMHELYPKWKSKK